MYKSWFTRIQFVVKNEKRLWSELKLLNWMFFICFCDELKLVLEELNYLTWVINRFSTSYRPILFNHRSSDGIYILIDII